MDISVWLPLWDKLNVKLKNTGGIALSDDERLWLLLRNHIDDVEDNSVIGFYCGEGSQRIGEVIDGWLSIGAEDMANIFERGNSLFINGSPPENEQEMDDLIETWQDAEYQKIFRELDEDFEQALPGAEVLLDTVIKRILEKNPDIDMQED